MTDTPVQKPSRTAPSHPENRREWYREPFAWLVLGIPAGTILWCIILFNIATAQPVAMVSDDYYKEGMGINMEVHRDRRAAAMGLSAEVNFSNNGEIHIRLPREASRHWPSLSLELIHPTLGEQDRLLVAAHQGGNHYSVMAPELMNGRWYLDIRDPDNQWRLKGEVTLPGQPGVTLNPRREAQAP